MSSPSSDVAAPSNHGPIFHYRNPEAPVFSFLGFLLLNVTCLASSSYISCAVQEQNGTLSVFGQWATSARIYHCFGNTFSVVGSAIQPNVNPHTIPPSSEVHLYYRLPAAPLWPLLLLGMPPNPWFSLDVDYFQL